MTPSPRALAGGLLGAVPGAALATAAAVAAAMRRTKPLHPLGRVGDGTLAVTPAGRSTVPLLDEPGEHAVLVRWSRAVGLEADKPDIEGMALRFTIGGEPVDLLLATTGDSTVGRHLLVVRSPGRTATFTTLLPVASDGGSLLLRLQPVGPWVTEPPSSWTLSWGRLGGRWHEVATLDVRWSQDDEDVRFDPVTHVLPGTRQYGVVTTMREPAYVAARLVRARPRTPD